MAHSRKARKRVRRMHLITNHLRVLSTAARAEYQPEPYVMTVHRYNPKTGGIDQVPDARGEYFNTKTGRWEHWDRQGGQQSATEDATKKDDVYQFFDRFDRIKGIWMQDVYKNGALSRTQERGWASKAMGPPSTHSPLCECVECARAKRANADPGDDDTDTVHTAYCACTACAMKREALRGQAGPSNYHSHPYGHGHEQKRTYTSYTPTKLYEKLDRKRWPNTWDMLVTFSFQPDYYKDTRVQPEQQEYSLYGE